MARLHLFPSVAALFLALVLPVPAKAELLAPFKDDLFAYPKTLSQRHGGRHRARRFGAPVPCDDDGLAEGLGNVRGCDEDRPSGFEQGSLHS